MVDKRWHESVGNAAKPALQLYDWGAEPLLGQLHCP